jgi:hypothetical protein
VDDLLEWARQERDRRAIEEVLKLYFSLTNQTDKSRLDTEVFAPNARMIVGCKIDEETGTVTAGFPLRGPEQKGQANKSDLFAAITVPKAPIATTHYMMQSLITLEGDQAKSETYAVSFLVIEGDPRRVLVRGIRYLDKFVRLDAGWRISERRPSHDWMFESDASFALALPERLQLHHLK